MADNEKCPNSPPKGNGKDPPARLPGWEVDLGTDGVPPAPEPVLPVILWRFLAAAIAPFKVSGGKARALHNSSQKLFYTATHTDQHQVNQETRTWAVWLRLSKTSCTNTTNTPELQRCTCNRHEMHFMTCTIKRRNTTVKHWRRVGGGGFWLYLHNQVESDHSLFHVSCFLC